MINARYVRPDNPYWSPEAGRTITGARVFFYALADFAGIGFGAFGVDSSGSGPEFDMQFGDLGNDYRMVNSALPVITELQGTSKLKTAVEEEGITGP